MKIDKMKVVNADMDIYQVFIKLNTNKREKYRIIGNLMLDLGHLDIAESIFDLGDKAV